MFKKLTYKFEEDIDLNDLQIMVNRLVKDKKKTVFSFYSVNDIKTKAKETYRRFLRATWFSKTQLEEMNCVRPVLAVSFPRFDFFCALNLRHDNWP